MRGLAPHPARLAPRDADFTLDPCEELEEQRNHVRETLLSAWLQTGLSAGEAQREAVLVRPDGKLDEASFRRLYGRRDNRPVNLRE